MFLFFSPSLSLSFLSIVLECNSLANQVLLLFFPYTLTTGQLVIWFTTCHLQKLHTSCYLMQNLKLLCNFHLPFIFDDLVKKIVDAKLKQCRHVSTGQYT